MTEMYKKYIKYKMKYLNLINKTEGGHGTPTKTKRNYSISETPEYPMGSSSKTNIYDNNKATDNTEVKELYPIITQEKDTSEKYISVNETVTTPSKIPPVTPIKKRISVYERMPIITPSKDVNKEKLIEILNSQDLKYMCNNRNFVCVFKDKRKTGDGCVLELWTRPLPEDRYYNVGHITVHKGISRSFSKSFHYKSDDFSGDGVNFNLIITGAKDEKGKYLTFGQNSINRMRNNFFELIFIYNRLGFKDLGNRIEDVVKDIIEYLNMFPDEIFYDPL